MTILDTFFLLFKTDAKSAQQDIASLDKQISQLAAKGKKRSEEENKELKELRKQRQEATQDLKDQTREVDKLSGSFAKLAESGAAALGAFTAFGAIKSGILNVTDLNAALNITAKRTGQSVEQLRALDATFQAVGAGKGNFLQVFNSAFEQQSAAFLPVGDPKALLNRIRSQVYGQHPEVAEGIFNRLGLPFDEGARAFIRTASPKEWADAFEQGAKNAKLFADQAKVAQDFENQKARTQQALESAYTKLATDILPIVNASLQGLADLINNLTGRSGGEYAIGAAGIVGGLFGGKIGGKIVKSLLGLGGAEVAAGSSIGLGGLAAVGALGSAPWIGSWAGAKIASWIKGNPNAADNKNKINSLLLQGGLSQENANGVIANLIQESGLDPTNDPRKHGRTENAYGLAQWGPARQADFAKIFGHDIHSSTLEEQVAFILWELNNTRKKTGEALRGASSFQSGSLFSSGFEAPANGLAEALKRGNLANDLARSVSGIGPQSNAGSPSKNYSVKIDNVNVHTQATDARDIASVVSSHLVSEIRNSFSQLDDGAFA